MLAHVRRAPAGGHPPQPQLVPPGTGRPRIGPQQAPPAELQAQRVEGAHRRGHPVHHRLVLLLPGAEQAVPEDEHPTVVAIDVARVLPVVHPVQGRRHQHLLQPAEAADVLAVDPELVGQLHPEQHQEQRQRQPQQRQGQVEGPVEGGLERALAQRRRQVEVLAGMVRLVRAPQQVVAVQGAMRPVEAEVHRHEAPQPHPGRGRVQLQQARVLVEPGVGQHQQQAQRPLQHHPQHGGVDAGGRVGQAVGGMTAVPLVGQLQQDQQDVQRKGQHRHVHGASPVLVVVQRSLDQPPPPSRDGTRQSDGPQAPAR